MKRFITYLTFLLLFAAVIGVQYFADIDRKKSPYTEPLVFRPEIVRAADIGLHNAAADFAWLTAIQYFGGGESRTYEKLNDYLLLSAELDPQFAYPYAFGVLLLPSFGQVDQGIEIALKGIENNVPDYRIPYYLATTYHINKDDPVNATKYFDLAANTAGAPEGIKRVAASFGSRADKRAKTIVIWEGIYTTTRDEVVKERAKNYLIHLNLLNLLDEASAQYYKINKKYPATPEDLVNGRILRAVPVDPFGFEYIFNAEGKAQTK
jgi:hypothetical protein